MPPDDLALDAMGVVPAPFAKRFLDWLRARDLELMGLGTLFFALVLGFIRIADRVRQGPLSIDERILLSLREPSDLAAGIGGEHFQGMVRDVTSLGSGTLTVLFTVGLLGYLLLTKRPAAALYVVIAVIGCWLLNDLLKDFFARERPTIVPHLMGASDPSFPSGHTMISATFYPTIAELFGRLVQRRRLRFYLLGLGVFVAALVGFTRIYLGVHYPTDVVAGLCLGFSWALLIGIVGRLLQRRGVVESREDGEPLEQPA